MGSGHHVRSTRSRALWRVISVGKTAMKATLASCSPRSEAVAERLAGENAATGDKGRDVNRVARIPAPAVDPELAGTASFFGLSPGAVPTRKAEGSKNRRSPTFAR